MENLLECAVSLSWNRHGRKGELPKVSLATWQTPCKIGSVLGTASHSP